MDNMGIEGRLRSGVGALKRRTLLSGTALALLAAIAANPASADPEKWGAHLDFEGRWGNARSLGDAGLFAPLWQNQTSLLFTDIRGRFDSQDGREGNFGLGYRQMLPGGWNFGAYGYYDVRRTSYGNMFNQVTLGAEMLSADWDFRTNIYAPVGSRTKDAGVIGGGNPFADFAGGTIQVVTPGSYQRLERAVTGFDGEIGWRAPVFDVDALTQVRFYGGGFYFDGGGITRDIAGPRGRIEFSIDDVAGFNGARLTLGAEVQHDDVRGTQGFAIARLRVPLQTEKATPRLSAQERRMTERVVRDVDIVTNTGRGATLKAEIREAAINTWNDQTVTDVAQIAPADTAALQAKLDALTAGSVVILNGAPVVLGTTTVNASQTLLGGGTVLALKGATTDTIVNFRAPGAAGNLTGAVDGAAIVQLGAGSVVGGLTVGNTSTLSLSDALKASAGPNAVAFGNTLTTVGEMSPGLLFLDSANGIGQGNTITTSGYGAAAIQVTRSANSTLTGNIIMTTGQGGRGIHFIFSANGIASGNTITTQGTNSYGIWADSSAGNVLSGNKVMTMGTGASGVYFSASTNSTVKDNIFGVIGGNTVYAERNSSFTANSSGNSLPAGVIATCGFGNPASSGTVSFTNGSACTYP